MNGKENFARGKNALKGGAYSLTVSAIVLAIAVAVNVFVSALPSSVTKLDISASKLYSVTSNTKAVISRLDKDVTIYWIVQDGEEDDVIANLLSRYESLSDHITVEKKNPDIYPTFARQYTDREVSNNSLVVECGDKNRYIGYEDIYLYETDMYSYTYSTSFDGEGALTSAVDYVTSDGLPVVYTLTGHGEADLPSTFADQLEKENISISSLSLLTVDSIPEDADRLMIYSPSTDISRQEAEMLKEYVDGGGKLMVMAGPSEESELDNLYSLLESRGVSRADGIVIEGDRSYYAFGTPYALIPDLDSENRITSPVRREGYLTIMPISTGLIIDENAEGVSRLMTTTSSAFSKAAGYSLDTYDKEDGDTDGPFALAVETENENGGKMVWFGCSMFLDDMYNAYSSGANGDVAMNGLSALIGESETMAIRSKSLNYNYLTISESASSVIQRWLIGVFPLFYLGMGIVTVVKRRRSQK